MTKRKVCVQRRGIESRRLWPLKVHCATSCQSFWRSLRSDWRSWEPSIAGSSTDSTLSFFSWVTLKPRWKTPDQRHSVELSVISPWSTEPRGKLSSTRERRNSKKAAQRAQALTRQQPKGNTNWLQISWKMKNRKSLKRFSKHRKALQDWTQLCYEVAGGFLRVKVKSHGNWHGGTADKPEVFSCNQL